MKKVKKILLKLAFPFIWFWNDIKKEAEIRKNETEEEWLDRQW